MKNSYEENRQVITLDCDCYNMDHIVRFEYWEHEDDYPEFYISQALNSDRPFFNRLKNGLKYIFRSQPYGGSMFGDTMIDPHAARDLLQFLQKYNEYAERVGWYNDNDPQQG